MDTTSSLQESQWNALDLELGRNSSETARSRRRGDGGAVVLPNVLGIRTLEASVVSGDPLVVLTVASLAGQSE